jgi:polyphenol oxidase
MPTGSTPPQPTLGSDSAPDSLPVSMQAPTWQWKTWNDLPYLTCSLLGAWPHGFFTQQFWPRPPAELTPVLHPTATAYRLKQIHGNVVWSPTEVEGAQLEPPETLAAGDGLITEQAGQAVWACSADCTPVLIGDRQTGQVAAIHAGWRGTSQKVVPQAIARMQANGSQLADLRVAMGPAIAGEVYQVSTHVAAEVGASIAPLDRQDLPAAMALLHDLPQSPILPDPEPGRVRLDVRRVNALQLEQLGLGAEQVAIAPHCTFQDAVNFFSFRRIREKKAQWSGIVSV